MNMTPCQVRGAHAVDHARASTCLVQYTECKTVLELSRIIKMSIPTTA